MDKRFWEINNRIKRFNYWTQFCFALSEYAYYDWCNVLDKKEYVIVYDEKLWKWAEKTFKRICRQHTTEYLKDARSDVENGRVDLRKYSYFAA